MGIYCEQGQCRRSRLADTRAFFVRFSNFEFRISSFEFRQHDCYAYYAYSTSIRRGILVPALPFSTPRQFFAHAGAPATMHEERNHLYQCGLKLRKRPTLPRDSAVNGRRVQSFWSNFAISGKVCAKGCVTKMISFDS